MRVALLALLVAAEVAAAPRVLNRLGPYPRLDRRDRLGGGAVAPDASLFRLLPSTASIPGGECSGQTITGTRGESITMTRSSGANCQKADGTWVAVTNDQPRVSNLMGQPGLLVEQASTNLLLYSRDLSNGAWTKTNTSCSLNATGITGASNSASTCTASAFLGTVTQSITTSGSRQTSLFVKRASGSAALELTRNNGASWTTLNSSNCVNATTYQAQNINSSTWSRCSIENSVTNPVIGLRFNDANDSFIIDATQDESVLFIDAPTSPIFTTGTAASRSADVVSVSNPTGFSNTAGCLAAKVFKPTRYYAGANPRVFQLTPSGGLMVLVSNAAYWNDGTNTAFNFVSPTVGVLLDLIGTWTTATNQLGISVNAGTPATATYDGALLGTAVKIGTDASSAQSLNGYMANIRLGAAIGDCAQ
jgi:hypothetical protein